MKTFLQPARLLLLAALCACSSVAATVTYREHIAPIVESSCSKCHNDDKKKADLDLTSYQGALKGSGSGPVVLSGNIEGSKLWKALNHLEEPFMPPNRPKLPEKELELFKKWIADGLLENAGGKAVAAVAPAVDFTLKTTDLEKPKVLPMPQDWPIAKPFHAARLNPVIGLAANPWSPLIAVAAAKQVLLFHADTLELLGVLPFTAGQPVALNFSRNGQLLLAAGGIGAKTGRVTIWDVASGQEQITLGNEGDAILCMDLRPDQSQMVYGGPSRLVKIVSTKTGEVIHKLKKHTDWVTATGYSPDGKMMASADRNGAVCIWEAESGEELFTLAGHKAAVTALSWRGDSKLLASSSEDGTVKLWELKEGKQAKSWTAHNGGVLGAQYGHDGRIVTCGRDNAVILWDGSGSKVRALEPSGDLPLRVVFSPDGSRIFGSDFSGHVTAWLAKDGKKCGELDTNPSESPKQLAASKSTVPRPKPRSQSP